MEKLATSLGITSLSKSQVSVMAVELDTAVANFRTRLLDAGPYTFVAADALVRKVREGGRVVNVHALVTTGVNGDGHREILGAGQLRRRRRRLAGLLPRPDRPWSQTTASSAPSSPNDTTNGPKAAATSASTSSPAPASPSSQHPDHHNPAGGNHPQRHPGPQRLTAQGSRVKPRYTTLRDLTRPAPMAGPPPACYSPEAARRPTW
jgi:Transposase, Mutator family